jgi:hypothetical protein
VHAALKPEKHVKGKDSTNDSMMMVLSERASATFDYFYPPPIPFFFIDVTKFL